VIAADGAPGSVRAGVRTLIVEDDRVSREALTRILRIKGYDVRGVETMQDGMAALVDKPACVILDLMLPDGMGTEILKRIRAEGLAIRVALLTGADRPLVEEARQFKPDEVFAKPVDLARLLGWLDGKP